MLGAMAILADGGISSGIMAEGGKVWQSPKKLGSVIHTGIRLRSKFAIGSLLVVTPVLFYLLRHHGASWLVSILIFLALIPTFFASLSGKILEIVPKLHQDVHHLQRIQIGSNSGRLGLLVLTLFVFPVAYVAILATGLAQIWLNSQLRRRARKFITPTRTVDVVAQQRVLQLVKRLLPGAIYFAFSGQLMIWLISFFGQTENVAQVGALGRITATLVVFQVIIATLVVPYFSKNQQHKTRILRAFFCLQIGCLVFTGLLSGIVFLVPGFILSILGEAYQDLEYELLLMSISACLGLISGAVHQVGAAMSIVPPPWWLIPYMMVVQIGLIFVYDFSIVSEVIWYTITTYVASLLFQYSYFLWKVMTSSSNEAA
jgi:hypothetical protein